MYIENFISVRLLDLIDTYFLFWCNAVSHICFSPKCTIAKNTFFTCGLKLHIFFLNVHHDIDAISKNIPV